MPDGVRELPEPIELLDLEHGNAISLAIDRFEMGHCAHRKNS